jgi:hypothetical protein
VAWVVEARLGVGRIERIEEGTGVLSFGQDALLLVLAQCLALGRAFIRALPQDVVAIVVLNCGPDRFTQTKGRPFQNGRSNFDLVFLVEHRGFEPRTPCLPGTGRPYFCISIHVY